MNIRGFNRIDNGRYIANLITEDFSEDDRMKMLKFSEPQIDLGGDFDDGHGLTYTLPSSLANVRNGSPFEEIFDSRDYADAEDRADLWKSTIITRIEAAMATLRAKIDTFSGETITQV